MRATMIGSAFAWVLAFGAWVGYAEPGWAATVTSTLAIDADTYIDSGVQYDCNHGAMTSSLKAVLNDATDGTKTRILMQLPAGLGATPAGMALESMKLCMYCTKSVSDDFTARLYPLTQSFVEGSGSSKTGGDLSGATWGTYDGTNPWTMPGGDYDALTYVDAVSADDDGPIRINTWAYWDLTALADNADLMTNGLLITVSPEDAALVASGSWETKAFAGSDDLTVALRPFVTVTYTVVPEPSSLLLLLTAVAGIGGWGCLRRPTSRLC